MKSSPHVQQLINFCSENIRLFEDLNSNIAFATNSRTWTSQLLWFSIFLIFRVENFSNFFFKGKKGYIRRRAELKSNKPNPTWSCDSSSSSSAAAGRRLPGLCPPRGHTGQLEDTLDNDVLSVLSVQLTDDLIELVIICLDADAVQDLFDFLGPERGIAPEGGQQIGAEVTHLSSGRAA